MRTPPLGARVPGRGDTHLRAHGAGQQDVEPLRELLERVADGESGLADVHRLYHA